jgi:hypothetical protein
MSAPTPARFNTAAVAAGAFHLLVVLALLLITLLSQNSAPAAILHDSPNYPDQIFTEQRGVPYFVKNNRQFEQQFPHRTPKRWRLERQVCCPIVVPSAWLRGLIVYK